MKYKCENDLNTLEFKDFEILDISNNNNKLHICTSGGIAKYNNPCNETLEDRYIAESEISFINAQIDNFYLEGGKYFDANDKLIEEYPDKVIDKDKYKETFNILKEGVIFFFKGELYNDKYICELAVDVVNDTYWISFSADKVIVDFDRFMNKVIH